MSTGPAALLLHMLATQKLQTLLDLDVRCVKYGALVTRLDARDDMPKRVERLQAVEKEAAAAIDRVRRQAEKMVPRRRAQQRVAAAVRWPTRAAHSGRSASRVILKQEVDCLLYQVLGWSVGTLSLCLAVNATYHGPRVG